jgi:predicted lipoprotein
MLPIYEDLATHAAALGPAVQALCADPTEETLHAAQDAWRAARDPWKRSEAFLFGPASDLRTASAIDFWPARPDSVEQAITAAPDPIPLEHVASLGAAAKGLPALEYLLFDPIGGDAAILAALGAADVTATRRCAFAAALGAGIGQDAAALHEAWRPEGGNYVAQVADAGSGTAAFESSQDGINQVVNSLVAILQQLSDMRLGAPLGAKAGGVPQPDEVESRFSDNSAADLIDAARGIEAVYLGRYEDRQGLGLSSLLADDPALDEQIRAQIADVIAKVEALTLPLREAVQEDAAPVQAALDSVKALRRLIAVDLANVLGVSVTINDNDGD